MEKLFIVLYSYSQISGFVGPIDTPLEKCNDAVIAFNQTKESVIKSGISKEGKSLSDKEKIDIENLVLKCEYLTNTPNIEKE